MWQRIQTVFLSIAILCLIAAILMPIWAFRDDSGKTYELYALHYSYTEDDDSKITHYIPYSITAILLIAAITVAIIEIGKFRDRILQIKLGALNSLFLAGGLGTAVYFATSMVNTYQGGQYGLGLWLPGVAVVCNWLAMRFIKRDEKIVQDSNRLR